MIGIITTAVSLALIRLAWWFYQEFREVKPEEEVVRTVKPAVRLHSKLFIDRRQFYIRPELINELYPVTKQTNWLKNVTD